MIKLDVACFVLEAGCCTHPQWVTLRGGSRRPVRFPALFALIEHPRLGYMLFDTGYTQRFFRETARWPYSLYAKMTPVRFTERESAVQQLRRRGIEPEAVRHIIISHFHADHVAGLRDFPNADFLFLQEAYDAVRRRTGWNAVMAGYLPGLLPDDFEARAQPIDESKQAELPPGFPFERGLDLLGDGSLIAVDVPGHAAGQIGLLLSAGGEMHFLCADAVWSSLAYRENRPPHPLAGLIMSDRRKYKDSFERVRRLHKLYPDIRIVPSHCEEMERSLVRGGGSV
ncbi:MBL fold metallo-hydrolase [Paenibacillus doosanensis]|uniref:MBL fold metallo-hydrolase n=1 Tax=Paenibacillus doosanensis TaxID=1229154 RepID=UPI00217F7338|nr:MBL fold metallo-hydrolase [Paenibacillus doosanensis]MCS7460956.1 MBL fold metallo-hydrolase [Paenibacillus doosanensis]